MNSKKPTDKKNLVFLGLLLLSNLLSWQLGSLNLGPTEESENFYRPDYDTVKIQAKSFVPFERQRPVHIKQYNRVIAYGLLLNEDIETGIFTLYCPKKFLQKLTQGNQMELVPFLEDIKITPRVASKGKNYEIVIP